MTWLEPLAEVCERTGLGFWNEPYNQASNCVFLIVALLGVWMGFQKKYPHRSVDDFVLSFSVFLIFLGSFLFHGFATRWAQWADFVPILLFVGLYVHLIMLELLSISAAVSFLSAVALMVVTVLLALLVPDKSLIFIPSLCALLAAFWVLRQKGFRGAKMMLVAGGLFGLSLLFRSLDQPLCHLTTTQTHAIGLHFIWHCLNGVGLYLLLRVFINYRQQGVVAEVLPPKL